MCVCVCVCVCMRACMCMCVCVCVTVMEMFSLYMHVHTHVPQQFLVEIVGFLQFCFVHLADFLSMSARTHKGTHDAIYVLCVCTCLMSIILLAVIM